MAGMNDFLLFPWHPCRIKVFAICLRYTRYKLLFSTFKRAQFVTAMGIIAYIKQETPMTDPKPLNWTTEPGIGYSVIRRGDGGMTLTFTDLSDATLAHWHEFALEHLLGADRRTRNLYD